MTIGLVLGLAAPVGAAAPREARAILACLRDPRCHDPELVVHRALGLGAPENSVEAIARAAAAGVGLVKIDLRASRDGEIFLLHDPRLDRTTTGEGRLADTAVRELAAVRLRNGEPLPRFIDVYRRFRERMVFVLDCKVDVIERVAALVEAEGAPPSIVFQVAPGARMQSVARVRARVPELVVAARLTRWSEVDTIRATLGRPPEIIHTDVTGRSGLAEVRRRFPGAKVYVKALEAEGQPEPLRYFTLRSLMAARPELILTDRPWMFQRLLRAAGAPGPR